MIAWAAVDVLEGRAVRLREGRREAATDYGSAEEAVARWADAGLRHLHLVDLGAAFGAPSCIGPLVRWAKGRWPELRIQAGGGVRSPGAAVALAKSGVDRVVVGSLLFTDSGDAAAVAEELGPSRCLAALDAREGTVRVAGWREATGLTVAQGVDRAKEMGFTEVLATDIARDGLLAGPNLALYGELAGRGVAVTASGGIRCVADLEAVAGFPDVSGAVVGVALYEGRIASGAMALWSSP